MINYLSNAGRVWIWVMIPAVVNAAHPPRPDDGPWGALNTIIPMVAVGGFIWWLTRKKKK